MIRGVNRQIIEVSETKNEYFERAILFVKPQYAGESAQRLRSEADKTVGNLSLGSARLSACIEGKSARIKGGIIRIAAVSCVAGAGLAAVVFGILRMFG